MFLSKTVGMHAPSYSSNALCVQRMEDSPRIQPTDAAQMTCLTPTIPHKFSKRKDSGFRFWFAVAAAADGRRGSNVYEVNPWLWQLGRGKPRLGGLTVENTTERKKAVRKERIKRGWETRRQRKADKT